MKSDVTPIRLGILEGVFIVFLVLKIVEHIDWSWWWVTAPLWVSPLLKGIGILTGTPDPVVSRRYDR